MKVELGTQDFWDRLASDPKRLAAEVCLIDISNLEKAMMRHASLRAWVNAAHETARIDEARAEFHVKTAYARAILKAREEKDTATGKSKSVEVLKAEAEVDQEVLDATEVHLDAQRKRGALRAMATALEDRLQMLIQLSANQRKEIGDANTNNR